MPHPTKNEKEKSHRDLIIYERNTNYIVRSSIMHANTLIK